MMSWLRNRMARPNSGMIGTDLRHSFIRLQQSADQSGLKVDGGVIFCSPEAAQKLKHESPKTLRNTCCICGNKTSDTKAIQRCGRFRRLCWWIAGVPDELCAECHDHTSLPTALMGFGVEYDSRDIAVAHVISTSFHFIQELEYELTGNNMIPPWEFALYGNGDPWFGWSDHGDNGYFADSWLKFRSRLSADELQEYLTRWAVPARWLDAMHDPASMWYSGDR